MLGFVVNHLFSYQHNLEADAEGCPNIGTLMFTPYLRIVPMHVCIVLGTMLGNGAVGVVVFSLLKTAADALMHVVEHRILRRAEPEFH